ncbi:MAG: LON peptidase substrate-binding domain-containing protein, partial [Clostridia bacterium]|nr:LON peptidase substrate-binding domain-containing protein [Clostridia bacterium]
MVDIKETAVTMPLLALRGLVVFPKTTASFDVARPKSANALKAAMDSNRLLFVVTQKDFYAEEPTRSDLYDIGCVVKVKQVLKVSDNIIKVLVEGICRAEYKNFKSGTNFYTAEVTECIEKPVTNREVYKETLLRRIKLQFHKFAALLHNIAPDVLMTVDKAEDI